MAAVPFMPLYVADYMADAAHLSTLEHGAYLLLIMAYWQRGEALPDDDKKLARIAGLQGANWRKVAPVLREFFVTESGKLFHHRIERELQHLRDKSLKNRKGGLARAKQMLSERSADAQRTVSHTDTDTEVKESNPPTPRGGVSKPDDVSDEVWRDFKRHRARHGGVSDRVIAGFRREADKVGWTLERAMDESITQGWRGFKADWVKDRKNGQQDGRNERSTTRQTGERVAARFAAGSGGAADILPGLGSPGRHD